MSLASLSLVKNGLTYYQKHFGAYLKLIELRNRFDERIRTLSDSEKKLDYIEFFIYFQIPVDVEKEIKPIYEKSNTYNEFFIRLSDKHDFCQLVSSWLESFVNKILIDNFWINDWLIDIDSAHINKVNIRIEEIATNMQEVFKEYYAVGGNAKLCGFSIADL